MFAIEGSTLDIRRIQGGIPELGHFIAYSGKVAHARGVHGQGQIEGFTHGVVQKRIKCVKSNTAGLKYIDLYNNLCKTINLFILHPLYSVHPPVQVQICKHSRHLSVSKKFRTV